MTGHKTILVLTFVTVALVHSARCGEPIAQKKDAEPPKKDIPISQLIQDLGSKRFVVRQEAARQLRARAKEAIPELLKAAAESKDEEIKEQAQKLGMQILWPKDEQMGKKQLERIGELAKRGEFHAVIETAVYWKDLVNEDTCRVIRGMARGAYDEFKGSTKKGLLPRGPGTAFKLQVGQKIEEYKSDTHIVADVFSCGNAVNFGMIVASRAELPKVGMTGTFLFVNSSLVCQRIFDSLVICNGDVDLRFDRLSSAGPIENSIIICSGNVHAGSISNCVIVAAGRIDVGYQSRSSPSVLHSEYRDFNKKYGLLSCKVLGAELSQADGRVTLATLTLDGPLDRSGFRKSDVIEAVNGHPITESEDLARWICRSNSISDSVFLTVRRGKTVLVQALLVK